MLTVHATQHKIERQIYRYYFEVMLLH